MMKKQFWIFSLILIVAGCSVFSVKNDRPAGSSDLGDAPKQQKAGLPDLGQAPELQNDTWLNTSSPLRLADLRGKVVLIDMWTYG